MADHDQGEKDDMLIAICEAINPHWNKGAAITEHMALDQAERVLRLVEKAWDEGANAAVEPVNTGTRMTLRARIPFPADENPYRPSRPGSGDS